MTPPRITRFFRPVRTRPRRTGDSGRWRLVVRAPGLEPVDITVFRGLPTRLSSMTFDDPFAENSFSFTLPSVTLFDRRGWGDLAWAVKDADLDIYWDGFVPEGYPGGVFKWEGYLGSFDPAKDGLTIGAVGAMRQVDLAKAKPEYPAQPIPYEWAIARQFNTSKRPDLRTGALRIEWPTWWKTQYASPAKGTAPYLVPSNVKPGDNWTGLLTRSTGSWEDALTGYVQGLLSSMYTPRGRFTLDLDRGRKPVLRHRDIVLTPNQDTVVVNPIDPGVEINLSEDWTQSANVAYGQGTSLSGVAYTGMEISSDGLITTYSPLAAARQVEPINDRNRWYSRSVFRREVVLEVQAGLDATDAQKVGLAHLQRFGDPGHTGTVTLKSDPTFRGEPIPRHLVRAGMTIQIPGVFGTPDGILLHITSSSYDFSNDAVELTVDSKYRDALTVDEVKQRGRDALSVSRMLVAGQYQPPVPDQLYPWNYGAGAGFIPSTPQQSSFRLFKGMPNSIKFPWTEWTTERPPRSAAWKSCYIGLGPANTNADLNWAVTTDKQGSKHGYQIQMAQAGTIRLLQIAAYDGNGNVLPVAFHVSIYYSLSVNVTSTPRLPSQYVAKYPPYKVSQHYPFFPSAWDQYNDDGTAINPSQNQSAVQSAGLIRAWGSSYEKAGYYPGSMSAGDAPTGLLVDESSWSWDTSHFSANTFDPLSPKGNLANPMAGKVYMLIYCDEQQQQPVYFAGRMFITPPGSSV